MQHTLATDFSLQKKAEDVCYETLFISDYANIYNNKALVIQTDFSKYDVIVLFNHLSRIFLVSSKRIRERNRMQK